MKPMRRKGILCLLTAIAILGGCKEEIEESTRYTFIGQTVASFLEDNEELYSDFLYILRRGERLSLMKAYGQYTVFAPTNDAVTRYLFEQDSIYRTTLEEGNPVWTGITSPELSELSDSMCKVIAQTHIVPDVYFSTKMEGDIIPTMNMNDRYLSLSYGVDENDHYVLYINGDSKIIAKDEEVENGVVHTISTVLNPSTNTLPTQVEEHDYFRIMSEAIKATGYDAQLQLYKDETYDWADKTVTTIYPVGVIHYPANRYYGYTAFLEPDTVFYAKGIYNLEQLKERCAEWYPKADASAPLTSKDNPLNQFVGYHLLDRHLPYSRLVCYKIKTHSVVDSEKDFLDGSDRYEFYETMSGKLIKITMPRSVSELQATILLNYYKAREGESVPADAEEVMNVKIYEPNEFRDMDPAYAEFSANALNGIIHPIEKILVYDEDVMVGRVLNTTIRFDASTLCPELTNNNIRWNFYTHITDIGETPIPNDYSKNMKVYTEETRTYYLPPHMTYHNYQGDEMNTLGGFDFAYKLPRVPAGTYEIRMGYTANERRHIVQFYVDDEVAGIPVDIRIKGRDPKIGFLSDNETEDNGIQNDKDMKNRGYMKASTTYVTTGSNIARQQENVLRKVIATKYLSEGDHWIRFKNANENDDGSAQFMYDYFELVPISYVRDENIPLEEKRK